MDNKRFAQACLLAATAKPDSLKGSPIGTLGEKTLHSVLKYYFEPDGSKQEIRIGSHFADILGDSGIIEIQTRQFNKLRNKLACFLPDYPVTLVYPVAETKWLYWIDESTGETTKKRKSPKTGMPYEIFIELYRIKPFLRESNLKISIVMLHLEEYRLLNGWSKDRKKGSTRYERIPLEIVEEINIRGPSDYGKIIPDISEDSFTSGEFKKASGLSIHGARTALNVLNFVGAVERIGKKGNAFVYRRTV
ncbi:MAG: hypothetical protein GX111_08005 [Clostridiales bacterium]|nr:hypothetical protein [Clostridiales bacterium]